MVEFSRKILGGRGCQDKYKNGLRFRVLNSRNYAFRFIHIFPQSSFHEWWFRRCRFSYLYKFILNIISIYIDNKYKFKLYLRRMGRAILLEIQENFLVDAWDSNKKWLFEIKFLLVTFRSDFLRSMVIHKYIYHSTRLENFGVVNLFLPERRQSQSAVKFYQVIWFRCEIKNPFSRITCHRI